MMGNYFVEAKSKIQQNLLKTQASSSRQKISPQMRAILINWMGEVAEHFFMKRITLHLAVAYLDRYLFVIRVDANKSDF
jgi:cyclin A